MEFDKGTPGEGMEIYTEIENGKALLEISFFIKSEVQKESNAQKIYFRLMDQEGNPVLELWHSLQSEELARGILLHPHLWKGASDPYLYRAEAYLVQEIGGEKQVQDVLSQEIPLCRLEQSPGKGFRLNGEAFAPKAVGYCMETSFGGQWEQDLQRVLEVGANAVFLAEGTPDRKFYELCCKKGLLLWGGGRKAFLRQGVPLLYADDNRKNFAALFTKEGKFPTELFYYYKAMWSEKPFVYLCGDSFCAEGNGSFRMTAYSNQKKVAFYVEGILFEFQSGGPEFIFQNISVKGFPAAFTAEAGGCSMSVTTERPPCVFTESSQNHHDSMTFTS